MRCEVLQRAACITNQQLFNRFYMHYVKLDVGLNCSSVLKHRDLHLSHHSAQSDLRKVRVFGNPISHESKGLMYNIATIIGIPCFLNARSFSVHHCMKAPCMASDGLCTEPVTS